MTRTHTDVDQLADGYLDEMAALNPLAATYWGVAGHDDRIPDLSPDGLEERSALRRRTLAALDEADPVDANDRITVAALREELGLAEQLRATGAEESSLNNIDSPLQAMRDIFDLMATETADDWAVDRDPAESAPGGHGRLHRVVALRRRPGPDQRRPPGPGRNQPVGQGGRLLRPAGRVRALRPDPPRCGPTSSAQARGAADAYGG